MNRQYLLKKHLIILSLLLLLFILFARVMILYFLIFAVISSTFFLIAKKMQWNPLGVYIGTIMIIILLLTTDLPIYINNISNYFMGGVIYQVRLHSFPYQSSTGNIQPSSLKILVGNDNNYEVIDLNGKIIKKLNIDFMNIDVIRRFWTGNNQYTRPRQNVSPDGSKVAIDADLLTVDMYTPDLPYRFGLFIYDVNSGKTLPHIPVCFRTGVAGNKYSSGWEWSFDSKNIIISTCDKQDSSYGDTNSRVIVYDIEAKKIITSFPGTLHSINGDGSVNSYPVDQVQNNPESVYISSPNGMYKFRFIQLGKMFNMPEFDSGNKPLERNLGIQVFDSKGNFITQTPRVDAIGSGKWSPDSKYILYGYGNKGVYIIDVKNGKEYKVSGTHATYVSWYMGN